MDYFSFYGLPLSFSPDLNLIKKKYYELSKKYHPDFYINESGEKQQEVLELSTLNNKAYQVLSDPQKRLQYILELKKVIHEGEHYVLPQSFLLEMMDINEMLMELQFDGDPKSLDDLKSKVAIVEKALNDELLQLTSLFETQGAEEKDRTLLSIKDLYYRNKYLRRIREGIKKAGD
jgi:molecular chaperone HscB